MRLNNMFYKINSSITKDYIYISNKNGITYYFIYKWKYRLRKVSSSNYNFVYYICG